MDSLTQGLLGAATFALVKDKAIGKKSIVIGAIAGTIPDLDVLLLPFFNEVEFLTVHRSFSHSIGFAVLLSFLLGEIFYRFYEKKHSRRNWQFAFFIAVFTHSLLDWCTTYGTKLISPIDDHLFSLNCIHVFEPIYTGILLLGVIFHIAQKRPSKTLRNAIIISSCYLAFGIISKNHAYYHFKNQLDKEKIAYNDILVSPTPLNSLLWHGIAKTNEGYHLSTYSFFDGTKDVKFKFIKSNNEIISQIKDNRLIRYYLDYAQDYPLIETDEKGNTKIYAIKYGPINYIGEPEFVYPLTFNINNLNDKSIKIDHGGTHRGPVKNYSNLIKRIFGNLIPRYNH